MNSEEMETINQKLHKEQVFATLTILPQSCTIEDIPDVTLPTGRTIKSVNKQRTTIFQCVPTRKLAATVPLDMKKTTLRVHGGSTITIPDFDTSIYNHIKPKATTNHIYETYNNVKHNKSGNI